MDSKIVSREIRRQVWPVLKSRGFDYFTGRSAWRHSDHKIDVVNFQSFNSYLAGMAGCTTYSFALNLGCYFAAIPWQYPRPLRQKGPFLLPEEFHCHLRLHLEKSIQQSELPRANIWLIKENGQYLPEAIADALRVIIGTGLTWFDQLNSHEFLLDRLTADDTPNWGTVARWSPKRHYLIGYIAKSLGDSQLAIRHMRMALNSGCFEDVAPSLRDSIRELASKV